MYMKKVIAQLCSQTSRWQETKRSQKSARVVHVFGYKANSMSGGFLRVIGIARATTKIALTNLVYNIMRFCYLHGKVLSKK